MDHNRPIDDGFVGKAGTKKKQPLVDKDGDLVLDSKGKQKEIPVYDDVEPVDGLTRTTTTVEWNPATQRWETKQHFPSATGWSNTTKSYTP